MSAAMYTNRIRTTAEARVRKVQYRFMESSNYNPLASTCNADPDYSVLVYGRGSCCNNVPNPIIPSFENVTFDGGNVLNVGDLILDGGTAGLVYNILLDGGTSVLFSGANFDGGTVSSVNFISLDGGTATTVYTTILDGKNS